MTSKLLLEAHIELSETLRDTHYGHSVIEHSSPPNVVQFSKAVGHGIPFVVRGIAKSWPAIDRTNKHRWTNEYLSEKLGENPVTVSLTGDGFADAVNWIEDAASHPRRRMMFDMHPNGTGHKISGQFVFASPYETQLPFTTVLKHLLDPSSSTIAHLQLQNDCLRSPEYSILLTDVPFAIPPWATPILGAKPEALNFWMGRHHSVSSMHSDPYENIYTVIRGVKVFILYPPCDAYFMHKQDFRMATWRPTTEETDRAIPEVELVLLDGKNKLPWIPITCPRAPAPLYPRFAHAPKPFVVRVNAGDSLYLPKGWLHHVEQEEDEEGLCIAVNAWYDGWEGMGLSWGWGQYAQKMEEMFSKDEF